MYALDLLVEYTRRHKDALNLYQPLPGIAAFHMSGARTRSVFGSNRAGKAQPVDEPVLTPNGWTPIGSLLVGDVVIGGDGNPCMVTGVYPQGSKPVFSVTFGDGSYTRCCEDHLWKVKTGDLRWAHSQQWHVLSLRDIRSRWGDTPTAGNRVVVPECIPWMPKRDTPLDPYLLGLLLGDGSLTSSASISTADDEIVDAVRIALPGNMEIRRKKDPKKVTWDYLLTTTKRCGTNPLVAILRHLGVHGKRSWEKFIPAEYLFNTADVRLAVLQGLMDTDGTMGIHKKNGVGRSCSFATTSRRLAEQVTFLVRSLGGKCSAGKWRQKNYTHNGGTFRGRHCVNLFIRMHAHCPFRLKRKADRWHAWRKDAAIRPPKILRCIEPDGDAECVCISVSSPDQTYVTRDLIVTHNTLSASAEVARVVRGMDPYGDVKGLPSKNGVMLCVGKDGDHLADPMWKKLSWPGAFWIIPDQHTGQWRSVRPDPSDPTRLDPYDESERPNFAGGSKPGSASLWKPAPPLIPPQDIAVVAWEDARLGVPRMVRLKKSNWEMRWHTSRGNIRMGIVLNFVWFDEEIEGQKWYPEARARLVDTDGRFVWSATPEGATLQLLAIHEMCESGLADVQEFRLSLDDNPYQTQAAKKAFFDALSEDERHVKYYGNFAIGALLTYPTYQERIHGIEAFPIPETWMRVLTIDPGAKGGILFGAVPPEKNELHIYDELVLPNASANTLAQKTKERAGNKFKWETFLMDGHAGRVTPMNHDRTVAQHWEAAFEAHGLESRRTGHGFEWGSDDTQARELAVKNYLEGDPQLKVHLARCPHLSQQLKHRIYRPGLKRRDDRTAHDMVDCLEYKCAYFDRGLFYEPPERAGITVSSSAKRARAFKKMLREAGMKST